MAAPVTVDEFLDIVRKSGVANEKRLDEYLARAGASLPKDPRTVADLLIENGVITNFQAENLRDGKWRRFHIGKYKILERLGFGGFAQVYLCEHNLMRRRVAVKVLPVAKTKGSSALERFHREARALGKLDHPNIVHFYDLDQDGDLHFLVLEYIDGSNLQDIVKKSGPMPVDRACHYIAQAAEALEHAREQGMVHRDIKPGNILVDRTGVVKLLDLGLALRAEGENSQLTKMYDDGTLGTADYISPEQVMDSHDVDIRADIYSLGATFYFLLTGWPPFDGLQIADKLLAHQSKQRRPITEYRNDVPAGVITIIQKMMSKRPEARYATPGELADALEPFTQSGIAPPPESEMPKLSPAATTAWTLPPPPKPPRPPQTEVVSKSPTTIELLTAEATPFQPITLDETPSPVPGLNKPKKATAGFGGKTLIIIVLAIGIVVLPVCLAGVATLGWLYLSNHSARPPSVHAPRKLEVSRAGDRRDAYPSISAALKNAEIGSVIELWDELYEENVVFDGSKGGRTSVTLQAAPGKKEIVWRSARNDPDTPLLRLIKTPEFKLKGAGIVLDGSLDKNRSVNDLILITLGCPGLIIEDLQMRHFARDAVLIMNADGSAERPIQLERLWTFTQQYEKPRAAIYFDANPKMTPVVNEHIHIGDCTFNGIEPKRAIQVNEKLKALGDDVRWPGR